MAFDPKAHLIQLPRRVKDPSTGQWSTRLDEYLEVKWRLVWFREKYPHGSIATEAIMLDWEKGIAIYKATVGDDEGGVATGTGTETRKSFEDFVEKSETRAIGRALAALGIGTQFVGEELSEGEHIADAPVSPPPSPPDTNGHAPVPDHFSCSNNIAMTMPQPPQEHLLPLLLRTGEQVGHELRDAIEHPPRLFQRLRIRFEPMPATQVVECQPLALGFRDLFPHPGKRSLVGLLVLPGINHRLISAGVPAQSAD